MAQRYKIFVNNIPLTLTDDVKSIETELPPDLSKNEQIIVKWDQTKKSIHELLRLLEQSEDIEQAVVYSDQYKSLKRAFHHWVEYVAAAGGVVRNDQQEILMIYRWERWDLPKGKVEEGEETETTAVREVKEETGLQEVEVEQSLPNTFHTFLINGKRMLKETFWYAMKSPPQTDFSPAVEEDIVDVKWMSRDELPEALYTSYLSIEELMSQYFDIMEES